MKSFALAKKYMISTKGLTLGYLLKVTEALRRSGAHDVTIKDLKFTKTVNGMLVARSKIESASRKGKVFDTWITFLEIEKKSQIGPRSKVMCQCSCEDYIYMWEYANAAHNAARIFYGDGSAPDERNPGQEPGLCKHCYALGKELLK